jgi:hypothetical protein
MVIRGFGTVDPDEPVQRPLLESELPEDLPPDELPLLKLEPMARLEPQSAAVPPLPPLPPSQIHVHGPMPDTADAVPDVHRLLAGAVVTVVPLADPHAPLTGVPPDELLPDELEPELEELPPDEPLPDELDLGPDELLLPRGAEQLASVPPPAPAQLRVHGPLPDRPDAVPTVHRLLDGAPVAPFPFVDPQAPLITTMMPLDEPPPDELTPELEPVVPELELVAPPDELDSEFELLPDPGRTQRALPLLHRREATFVSVFGRRVLLTGVVLALRPTTDHTPLLSV